MALWCLLRGAVKLIEGITLLNAQIDAEPGVELTQLYRQIEKPQKSELLFGWNGDV